MLRGVFNPPRSLPRDQLGEFAPAKTSRFLQVRADRGFARRASAPASSEATNRPASKKNKGRRGRARRRERRSRRPGKRDPVSPRRPPHPPAAARGAEEARRGRARRRGPSTPPASLLRSSHASEEGMSSPTSSASRCRSRLIRHLGFIRATVVLCSDADRGRANVKHRLWSFRWMKRERFWEVELVGDDDPSSNARLDHKNALVAICARRQRPRGAIR